ncbi:MAG: mechanosensitive ion channel [Candidatus Methanoperedens sp.]|nr:mechanosensitive ion channel [Candidatus Methanoperedens sp.]MCZ7361285.1 mechanosensitive ion channel [Candidatus Methanoperedens sp.]HLB70940.1 mechanosensitive ion channel domain-containing protein [Candidatus Methanoperedens sp.]
MELQSFLKPVLIIILSFITAGIVDLIIRKLKKRAEKTETKLDDILLHALSRPLYILIIVIGIYYAIHQTPFLVEQLNQKDAGYQYRKFIITIFITWVIASLAKRIIRDYGYGFAARTEGELDDRLVAFADMSATYVIWLIGIMVALSEIGIEITPIITGMGIAGLAIALAAQNLLSNVFGGVTITLDQLYKVGDRIEMGGVYGDVYEIKPRYTRIKTLDNTIITVPNSKVINDQIINFAVPDTTVRVKIPISVAYGTDPKKVDTILYDIVDKIPLVMKNPRPIVRFTEYASSSQNFELLVWIRSYDERHPVMDRIFRDIFVRFKEEGIEIPFSQMDVHIKKDQ